MCFRTSKANHKNWIHLKRTSDEGEINSGSRRRRLSRRRNLETWPEFVNFSRIIKKAKNSTKITGRPVGSEEDVVKI